MTEVEYKVSLNSSRFLGYQSKKKQKGTVKVFAHNIFNVTSDFDDFVREIIEQAAIVYNSNLQSFGGII